MQKVIIMAAPIHKAKDASFKVVFDEPELFVEFLRDYIPVDVLKDVKPADIEDSIVAGLIQGIPNNPFFRAAKIAGWTVSALEVAAYIDNCFFSHGFRVEEAVSNHFDSGVWVSASRNIVDKKVELTMQNMTRMIYEGKIGVRKACDVFNSDSFWQNHDTKMTGQFDPLTGRDKLFKENEYYFFMVDDAAVGIVNNMETIMRNITR